MTVVSQQEWLQARKELLAREKELTRKRDELRDLRQNLPWVQLDKSYTFDGPNGRESLSDLFGGRSQLIVYHFMLGPEWPEGCPSCSMVGDSIDGFTIHLEQRDVSLVVVSRAPYSAIEQFQRRMGWNFKWVSSFNTDFNYDFHVSFTEDEVAQGQMYYNYDTRHFPADEAPGLSVFTKQEDQVFHTYSTYGRGAEPLLPVYHYLDLTPKGRNEQELTFPMAWVRHHDKYTQATSTKAGCCEAPS